MRATLCLRGAAVEATRVPYVSLSPGGVGKALPVMQALFLVLKL